MSAVDERFETVVRIAEVIYGDGDDVSWARATELADLIAWEVLDD